MSAVPNILSPQPAPSSKPSAPPRPASEGSDTRAGTGKSFGDTLSERETSLGESRDTAPAEKQTQDKTASEGGLPTQEASGQTAERKTDTPSRPNAETALALGQTEEHTDAATEAGPELALATAQVQATKSAATASEEPGTQSAQVQKQAQPQSEAQTQAQTQTQAAPVESAATLATDQAEATLKTAPAANDAAAALVKQGGTANAEAEAQTPRATSPDILATSQDGGDAIKTVSADKASTSVHAPIDSVRLSDAQPLADLAKASALRGAGDASGLLSGSGSGLALAASVQSAPGAPLLSGAGGIGERLAASLFQSAANTASVPVTLDKVPQAVVAVALNARSATLQIDPPELGRIQLEYQFDSQGRTVVTLTPESDAARTALSERMASISAALQESAGAEVDVHLGDARDFGSTFESQDDASGNGSEHASGDRSDAPSQPASSAPDPLRFADDGSDRLHILV